MQVVGASHHGKVFRVAAVADSVFSSVLPKHALKSGIDFIIYTKI